ncbi:hypothetical protein DPMN_020949 [Dreissena polymorpha]|uniref:Uncharacterized protein n=1 Tax=Dreissena polymorpha TaxID=45954 RepID=A0A9D4NLE9_DREPO|nr:hypothetical protein DPMN_020949 [Dreissena polymorpha]
MTKVMSSVKPNYVHGSVKTHSSRSSRSELIAFKQAEAESAKIACSKLEIIVPKRSSLSMRGTLVST